MHALRQWATARRVGAALSVIVLVWLAVALIHGTPNAGPTAATLSPILDTGLAIYVIAVVSIAVSMLSGIRGSRTSRRVKATFVVALLVAVAGVGIFLAPFFLLVAVVMLWRANRVPRDSANLR